MLNFTGICAEDSHCVSGAKAVNTGDVLSCRAAIGLAICHFQRYQVRHVGSAFSCQLSLCDGYMLQYVLKHSSFLHCQKSIGWCWFLFKNALNCHRPSLVFWTTALCRPIGYISDCWSLVNVSLYCLSVVYGIVCEWLVQSLHKWCSCCESHLWCVD